MKHYTRGGSTAARTIKCPSWVVEAAKNPKQGTSEAAAEGTVLHSLIEQLIADGDLECDTFMGKSYTVDDNVITIDEDHIDRLDMAVRAFTELDARYRFDDVLIEAEFAMTDDIGGTCDILAYNKTHVVILDWKFGQGLVVDPVENAQGMFYAMCAEHNVPALFEGKQIVIAIVQPLPSRADTETLKIWEVPPAHYRYFKHTYMASVEATGYNAGSHCAFCPGAATCPVKTGKANEALKMDAKNLDKLVEALELATLLEPWIKAVKKIAHEQLEEGAQVKGWKLVDKRATRKWSDEGAALAILSKLRRIKKEEYMTTPALKSVAQLEKTKFDMSVVSNYITKSSTGTTLAPESDPREQALSESALRDALNRLA